MPSGGADLARPPITVWRAGARAQLATLLHGAHSYSMGAGGFDQVPAIPQMQRLRQPANVNREREQRVTQLYSTQQLTIKQRLEGQFGRI
jgi:hypothetical protein